MSIFDRYGESHAQRNGAGGVLWGLVDVIKSGRADETPEDTGELPEPTIVDVVTMATLCLSKT
jgi:hypothetical protein